MSVYVVVIAKCAILTNLTALKYPIKRFGAFLFELILLHFAGIEKILSLWDLGRSVTLAEIIS